MPKVPPKGRPFCKGNRANAKGSSAKSQFRASLKRMMAGKIVSAESFAELISAAISGTPAELAELYQDPEATTDFKIVAKGLEKALRTSDIRILLELMTFVVGKPREHKTHEHSGPDGGAIVTTASMSDEEIAKELAAIRARRGQK